MRTQNQIFDIVKKSVEDVSLGVISKDKVEWSSRLIEDLGLDSLDYASVMISVEKETDVSIEEDKVVWSEVQTAGQLADLFFRSQK
jgi:acyl carrier protein